MAFWGYLDAHKIKTKMQRDYDNQLAWLSGMYVRNAVGSILNGEEYPIALDFREMDRWNELSEVEKTVEQQKEAVINSRTQMDRIARMLQQQKDGD